MKNILSFIKYGAIAIICGMLFMTSCKKNGSKAADQQINGEWELVSTTADPNGEIGIKVYLSFNDANKTFEVFQKLGKGRFRHLDGTYNLTDKVLTGTYSDDKPLASNHGYDTVIEGDVLTLTTKDVNPVETNVYKRSSIPADVKAEALEYEEGVKSVDSYRAL